ncbi:MAG: DUF4384 domain-containing protein [Sulfitobacter sp.]
MSGRAGIWAAALTASTLVHIGAAVGLLAALQPEPIADQPVPESQLNVQAHKVTRSDAAEQETTSDAVDADAPQGTALGAGAVAQSEATARALPSETPQVSDPTPDAVTASTPKQPVLTAALPSLAPASAQALVAQPIISAPLQTPAALPVTPSSSIANTVTPPAPVASPVKPVALASPPRDLAAAPTPQIDPQSVDLLSQEPTSQAAQFQTPALNAAPQKSPQSSAAPLQTPQVVQTALQEPDVTSSKAVLAFPAGGNIDPVSLAAFQSFTQPGSTEGANLRDGLAAALSLPCSRMQVIFDPETTTLQLTGHVPDPAMRGPVLSAVQSQMGSDIAVSENLLILPAPQCGALTGIADVGLPQSTDQITNPLIVGNDTHARAFRYVTGDALILNLTAPDYPAYVYIDYFDADGNVIHLAPNTHTPLELAPQKSALQVGARSAEDTGLFITIGPPYGQEIAAAFAASQPLYEGERPLVEPAEPYLKWLKTRVADARARDSDFKGEWVYFFVTTAPN